MSKRTASAIARRLAPLPACLLLLLRAAPGLAQLVAEPSAVTPEYGRPQKVILTAPAGGRGASAMPMILAPAGVTATAVRQKVRADEQRRWTVTVAAAAGGAADSTVLFELPDGGHRSIASLKVTPRPAPAASSQIAADALFEGDTLLDGQERPLLVKVSNLSDAPLSARLSIHLPPFVQSPPGGWSQPFLLTPRSTRVVPIPLVAGTTAGHPVISGRHQFAVTMAAVRAGPVPWSGQVVASGVLPVGVPGVADVLGAFQIPSFLMLPGFLLVTSFVLSTRLIRRMSVAGEGKGEAFNLAVGWSSGLWLIAIVCSAVLVGLYPTISPVLLGTSRNILYGYDLADVIAVWSVSTASGLGAALIWVGGGELAASRRARRAFSADLTPLGLLQRLERRGGPFRLPVVTLEGDIGDPQLFALDPAAPGEETWAASAISCTVPGGSDPRPIGDALASEDLPRIVEVLEEALGRRAVTLRWTRAGAVTGVARVPRTTFAKIEPAQPIVALG